MLCKILIILQMAGFHLSASVIPPQGLQQAKGNFNVAVVFDRRRISSCTCTCNSQPSWCSHVVALCLYRIHQVRTAIVNRWTYIMSSIGNCCMLCIWNGYLMHSKKEKRGWESLCPKSTTFIMHSLTNQKNLFTSTCTTKSSSLFFHEY